MNPILGDELVRTQLHIEELHRAAAAARRACDGRTRRRPRTVRRAIGARLVDLGLVLIDGRPS